MSPEAKSVNSHSIPLSTGSVRMLNRRGAVLLLVLVLLPSLALMALFTLYHAEDGFHRSVDMERRIRTTYLAEAGLHTGLQALGTLPLSTTVLPYLLVPETSLGEGAFQAELLNDAEDSGGATDTNQTLVIRATGFDSNRSHHRVLEAVVVLGYADFPDLPGTLTLGTGTTAILSGNMTIDGFDPSNGAVAGIAFESPGQTITENGSVQVRGDPDYDWASSAFSSGDGFVNEVRWFIERLSTSSSAVHLSRPVGKVLGTTSAPQVSVVDAGVDLSLTANTRGAGILVVLGDLSISGNFDYDGLILVAEGGSLDKEAGSAVIRGGLVVVGASEAGSTPVRFVGRSSLLYSKSAVDVASRVIQAPTVRSYLLKN